MRVFPGVVFPARLGIPRDACVPAHKSLLHLCSTSHSDMCFPGYFVSPPPLRRFTTWLAAKLCMM